MDAGPPHLPQRDPGGHKGTFGTVTVIGGCAEAGSRMFGAPALAARAALRAGSGLCVVAVPGPLLDRAISLVASATGVELPVDAENRFVPHACAQVLDGLLDRTTVLAIGPGLGPPEGASPLVVRAVGQDRVPVVADADALNALATMPDVARDLRAPLVLTPHPGEFARLAAGLSVPFDPKKEAGRAPAAEDLARRLGCVCVLKGRGTVVTDGLRTWVCDRGHACLATAGTGDVLTGTIAGVVSQFVAPGPRAIGSVELPRPAGRPLGLFEAACLGVRAHAVAGELWASRRGASAGLLAEELADLLPEALEGLREP